MPPVEGEVATGPILEISEVDVDVDVAGLPYGRGKS